ncbi:dTMP kinase [Microbispora sp. H10949]|uniref:dTMP kinase n=1 Tax=Microbispora sp. H10949 TaxID=2729111 RepID=UPI001602F7ED|nr:hypothetical protein [Microbispora sp. H10949]
MTSSDGCWISIDGVDGTGKSTIAPRLATLLRAKLSDEFSQSALGASLRMAVDVAPNYILHSRVGQSLAFLGDFFEIYETQIAPAVASRAVIVSDRGWLSKYAFQFVTLAEELGADQARTILADTLGLLPRPNLTLYLIAPMRVVQQRIAHRDGTCDSSRTLFNRRAHDAAQEAIQTMKYALPCIVIDATNSLDRVLSDAVIACSSVLPPI